MRGDGEDCRTGSGGDLWGTTAALTRGSRRKDHRRFRRLTPFGFCEDRGEPDGRPHRGGRDFHRHGYEAPQAFESAAALRADGRIDHRQHGLDAPHDQRRAQKETRRQ